MADKSDGFLPSWVEAVLKFVAEPIFELVLEYFFLYRKHGGPVLEPVPANAEAKKGEATQRATGKQGFADRFRDAAREFEERRGWLMRQIWGTEKYPRLQERYLAAMDARTEEKLELALLILTAPANRGEWQEGLNALESHTDDRRFAAAIDMLMKESVLQRILRMIPGGERYVTRQVIAARRDVRSIGNTWWGRLLGGPNAGILRPKPDRRSR